MPWIQFLFFVTMSTLPVYDFNSNSELSDWYVVNDGVMGGLSRGSLEINKVGNAVFSGKVSLENNGGFTSIRYPFTTRNIEGYPYLVLRVKGDGKRYQVRVKPDTSLYYSFVAYMDTKGTWETIKIPLRQMYPVFRGFRLDLPNYEGNELGEVGILIGTSVLRSFAWRSMPSIWNPNKPADRTNERFTTIAITFGFLGILLPVN